MNKDEMLQLALAFVKAVEEGRSNDELDAYYHPDVQQTEFPNSLTRQLIERNIGELKAASVKGKQVISKQTCKLVKSHVTDDTVILELFWTGTLAIPLGKLQAGENMEAYFAQFFEFKDGLIYRQRNYDCFVPFS